MKIKLAILDIDGIMTDGKKTYDLNGNVVSKTYCDKDFTAIKRLRASGTKVCFLSGCDKVNKAMAVNRNIDFYYARGEDKANFISHFCQVYDCSTDEMLYIGDDLFDLNILKAVGHPYCPKDSPKIIQQNSFVLDRNAGENLIAFLYDHLKEKGLVNDTTMEEIEKLDKREIF